MAGMAGTIGEFAFIERFFRPLSLGDEGSFGLRNDGAVFSLGEGLDVVVTTDTMVSKVHFLKEESGEYIGSKLLRVNVSDLAAMGALPFGYTLNVGLGVEVTEEWMDGFTKGLQQDQAYYGMRLLGGDTVRCEEDMVFSMTAFGCIPHGQALTRYTAAHDERIFVTGTIGDAALGLKVLQHQLQIENQEVREYFLGRLRRPEPRLQTSISLRQNKLVSAMIDISDGLVADLGQICSVSGCGGVIESKKVPFSEETQHTVDFAERWLVQLLTAGDDYELLFTAPERMREDIAAVSRSTKVPITEIGWLTEKNCCEVTVLDFSNTPLSFHVYGWKHF